MAVHRGACISLSLTFPNLGLTWKFGAVVRGLYRASTPTAISLVTLCLLCSMLVHYRVSPVISMYIPARILNFQLPEHSVAN